MIYPTQLDWAYLAGMIDGEGCIRVAKHHKGILIKLAVYSTDPHIAYWMAERFGGKVVVRHRNPLHSAEYRWEVTGDTAANRLHRLQPLLKIKQRQAWLAQEAWAQRYDGGCRKWLVSDELRALRYGFYLASLYLNQRGAR